MQKEQRIRLFFTIAACIIIVALSVALILVLIPSGEDDDSERAGIDYGGFEVANIEEQPNHEDAREEARQEAARILDLLKNYTGDDFDLFFTNLMFEYSQDPGSFSNPGGYLFQHGDMVEEFYRATINLDYGEISDLVETSFGVHIIYRIPIDPDAVPIDSLSRGDFTSLRSLFAIESFISTLDEWITDFEPEFTPEYESFNIAELLTTSEASDDIDEPEYSDEPDDSDELAEAQVEMSLDDIDFDEIFAKFEPDTPMIVYGEFVITWEELFSDIYWGLSNIYRSLGTIPDLSEPLGGDTTPIGEALLDIATTEALNKLAILYNANLLGIGLADEDYQLVDDRINELVEQYGSEEELIEALWEERGIKNIELFRETLRFGFLPYVIFRDMYGEESELFPSSQVLIRAKEEGFVMAKHILITFS